MKTRVQLPHLLRMIPALNFPQYFEVATILLFILLLGINLGVPLYTKPTPEELIRRELLTNFEDSSLHEKLGASYLLYNGQAATQEYKFAQEYYVSSPSTSISPWSHFQDLIGQRKELEKESRTWKQIKDTHGEYTYANLKLSEISFRLNNEEEASHYLNQAKNDNPFEKNVKLLESSFSNR